MCAWHLQSWDCAPGVFHKKPNPGAAPKPSAHPQKLLPMQRAPCLQTSELLRFRFQNQRFGVRTPDWDSRTLYSKPGFRNSRTRCSNSGFGNLMSTLDLELQNSMFLARVTFLAFRLSAWLSSTLCLCVLRGASLSGRLLSNGTGVAIWLAGVRSMLFRCISSVLAPRVCSRGLLPTRFFPRPPFLGGVQRLASCIRTAQERLPPSKEPLPSQDVSHVETELSSAGELEGLSRVGRICLLHQTLSSACQGLNVEFWSSQIQGEAALRSCLEATHLRARVCRRERGRSCLDVRWRTIEACQGSNRDRGRRNCSEVRSGSCWSVAGK